MVFLCGDLTKRTFIFIILMACENHILYQLQNWFIISAVNAAVSPSLHLFRVLFCNNQWIQEVELAVFFIVPYTADFTKSFLLLIYVSAAQPEILTRTELIRVYNSNLDPSLKLCCSINECNCRLLSPVSAGVFALLESSCVYASLVLDLVWLTVKAGPCFHFTTVKNLPITFSFWHLSYVPRDGHMKRHATLTTVEWSIETAIGIEVRSRIKALASLTFFCQICADAACKNIFHLAIFWGMNTLLLLRLRKPVTNWNELPCTVFKFHIKFVFTRKWKVGFRFPLHQLGWSILFTETIG